MPSRGFHDQTHLATSNTSKILLQIKKSLIFKRNRWDSMQYLEGANVNYLKTFSLTIKRHKCNIRFKLNVLFWLVECKFEMYLSCYTETTGEASLECKTMPFGPGKSSSIFSFIRNRGMKASIVVLCILFILLGIAHIFLFIVQRIRVNNNAIPV